MSSHQSKFALPLQKQSMYSAQYLLLNQISHTYYTHKPMCPQFYIVTELAKDSIALGQMLSWAHFGLK